MIEDLAAERGFDFSLERACFLTVLHRLMISDSDRSADAWREDYRIEGTDDLALQRPWPVSRSPTVTRRSTPSSDG